MARKKTVATPEVPIELKRAIADRKAGADSEALLNEQIDVWGGTRKLARDSQ